MRLLQLMPVGCDLALVKAVFAPWRSECPLRGNKQWYPFWSERTGSATTADQCYSNPSHLRMTVRLLIPNFENGPNIDSK